MPGALEMGNGGVATAFSGWEGIRCDGCGEMGHGVKACAKWFDVPSDHVWQAALTALFNELGWVTLATLPRKVEVRCPRCLAFRRLRVNVHFCARLGRPHEGNSPSRYWVYSRTKCMDKFRWRGVLLQSR